MSDREVTFSIETAVECRPVEVRVEEGLDRPYLARVRVEVLDPEASPEAFLGQDAILTWGRETYSRRLCGVVRGVRGRGRDEDRTHFELEIVPAFALLGLTRNTRMFQNQKVPDILEAVLKEKLDPYGRELTLELDDEYPSREYCLQYQESDLDFVQRLMEEEGISYAFDHQSDVEALVLRDANGSYSRVADAVDPVPYRPHGLATGEGADEAIVEIDRVHDTTRTAVTIRDHDFSTPGQLVEDAQTGEDRHGLVRESYEHGWGRTITITGYDAGAMRYQERDTPRQKNVRLEAHTTRAIVGLGVSRVVGFVPGATFSLVDHPAVGMDGEYLITAVTHHDSALPGEKSAEAERYHNTFECIPLSTPHRPRRTVEKPRIPSIQTAVVTGPSGEEIHTDEHGRIKVQFHWDRENPADETSSCWVRVQQKWAGAGWGFFWLPRMGMEVVVQFFDGDPDRPLVTGSVFNAANPTPYELPADKTKSTIKSNTTPGGGGFNEWRFEDKSGEEQVFTHAQKDYNEVVEKDHTTDVGNDQTIQVDANQTQTIHDNQVEDVAANQVLTVDGNRSVHVEGNFDETVDGTETRTVTGAVDETFDANETRDVGANLTETFGATETRTIGASQSETIGSAHSVTIGAASSETIGAALSETITGGITTSVGANWTVTAAGGFNVTAPAGINLTLNGPLTLSAPGGVMQVDGGEEKKGKFFKWAGALAYGGCILKDETYGAAIGLTGVMLGGAVASIPNLGFLIELKPGHKQKVGIELKAGSVEIHKWGLKKEG